jgi:hypothetical protein
MRRYHFFRLHDAERILKDYQPDVILLGEDGIAIDLWAIIAARRLGIKVAVLPYGMGDSSSLIWKGVEQKAREGDLITVDSPGGRFVKKRYPKWVKATAHGEVMMLPPAYIIALEEIGVRLRDPWCFQGGDADILLIEGEVARKHYLSEGVPGAKLRSVGSIYCDVLYDAMQLSPDSVSAFDRFGTLSDRELKVLFCVPPSESSSWTARSDFPSHAAFVIAFDEYMRTLPNVSVCYSFHPRMLP